MRIRSLLLLSISLLVLTVLSLTACGTLEITIETQGSSQSVGTPTVTAPPPREIETLGPGAMTPTPTPWDYTPPIPEAAFTPMPVRDFQAPEGLHIAFVKEGDIWLWSAEDRQAARLTTTGDVDGDVRISDDGQLVAFLRAGELWLNDVDNSTEQLLVSTSSLDEMGLEGGAGLHRFQWVPGRHILAFNTRRDMAIGLVLNDDLHLVDADSLERAVLLPPGEGGEFYFSPDGSQIALVTPTNISLINADGQNRHDDILTYTQVATRSEFQYYAKPVWAADGNALRVAVPPADPFAGSEQIVTIWHIPTDGSPAWLVESVAIATFLSPDTLSFSSDLGYVAYIQHRGPDWAQQEQAEFWLELKSLESDSHFWSQDIDTVFDWAPDSLRFGFLLGLETPQLQIGQWSGRTFPGSVDAGTPIIGFDWADADHYVVQVRRGWAKGNEQDIFDLVLADITGANTVVDSSSDLMIYDLVTVDQPSAE